jgi:anti-sigma B factor antagonist
MLGMSVTHLKNDQHCLISISGALTINSVNLTQTTLLDLLQTEEQISIDLSEINDIDSAGLQLLISLKNFSTAQKIALQFTGHSRCMLDIIDLYKLENELGVSQIPGPKQDLITVSD